MLGVAIVLLLMLVGYPLLWLVLGALGVPGTPTVEHLARVSTRAQNYNALVNTLLLASSTGLMSIVLGVPLAWATARSDMPLRRIVHALVALSYITPPYLTALAYIILMGPDAGHFNRVLRWLLGLRGRASEHLQHGRHHLRHRHPCLCLHLFPDLHARCSRSMPRSRSWRRCWAPAAGP